MDCQCSVHRVWINAIGFHNVTLKNNTGPSQRKRLFVVKECTTQIQQENRPLSADIQVEWISENSEISAEHMRRDSYGRIRHNGVSGCDCVCVNDPNMWVRLEKLGIFVWTGAMEKSLHKDFSVLFLIPNIVSTKIWKHDSVVFYFYGIIWLTLQLTLVVCQRRRFFYIFQPLDWRHW